MLATSTPGAGDTQVRHRIDGKAIFGNVLAAFGAISVFAVLNASECRIDTLQIAGPRALGRLGHGLALHGVHARQPADRLLIKRHRGPVVLRKRRQRLQLALQRLQPLARRLRIDCHLFHRIRICRSSGPPPAAAMRCRLASGATLR